MVIRSCKGVWEMCLVKNYMEEGKEGYWGLKNRFCFRILVKKL